MKILIGWFEHFLVGCLCIVFGVWLCETKHEIVFWSTIVGVMHEGTQGWFSDFREATNPPAPWNGILDLTFFILPSLIWWMI